MSNQKGNQYPLWFIANNYQVFAGDSSGQAHSKSNEMFAMEISISEDGTVWVLSTTPDPDGGGAKLFWSNGDGNWNEINTPDPGGVYVAGGKGSSCYYVTGDGVIRSMDTDGTSNVVYNDNYVITMDYGGGYIWAIIAEEGKLPRLYFSEVGGGALSFKPFEGDLQPYNISVSYSGDCNGTLNYDPYYFSKDGKSSGSSGSGASGKALQVSSKNWTYLISTEIGPNNDNIIMEWVDTQGGTYQNTSFEGIKVAATYNRRQ